MLCTIRCRLARHVETLGYERFWLAEHHNMTGIASAATSVVIGYVAGGTSKIRVGAGGIMLPNHAPLVIAEQFGTLESLYPNRIDLGLGRAPGSDQRNGARLASHAIHERRRFSRTAGRIKVFLARAGRGSESSAQFQARGLNIPLWLLGSSGFSARGWRASWVCRSLLPDIFRPNIFCPRSNFIATVSSLRKCSKNLMRCWR